MAVYYVRRLNGDIKIGVARHIPTRMTTLRKEHGDLELLKFEEGSHKEETARHKQFEDDRLDGEWFKPSPVLLAHIEALPEVPKPIADSSAPGGFVMVPAWLLGRRPSGNAILMYCALARFGTFNPGTGMYDECRPSLPTLEQQTLLSRNTIRRAMDELQKLGAIERSAARYGEDGGQLPYVYRVAFGAVTPPPPVATGGATSGKGAGATSGKGAGATSGKAPGPPVAPNQEPSTKNPSPRGSSDADAPNAGQLLAKWIDWLAERDIQLTNQQKARYAKELKQAIDSKIKPELIGKTLMRMFQLGKLSNPQAFQHVLIDLQSAQPVSGPPATSSKPFVQQADEYKDRKAQAEKAHGQMVDKLMDEGMPFAEALKRADEAKRAYLAQEPVASSSPVPYIDGVILAEEPKEVTGS